MEIDKLKFKLIKILISLSGQNQENLILKYNIKGTFAHYDNNFLPPFLFYFKLSKITLTFLHQSLRHNYYQFTFQN